MESMLLGLLRGMAEKERRASSAVDDFHIENAEYGTVPNLDAICNGDCDYAYELGLEHGVLDGRYEMVKEIIRKVEALG